MSFDPRQTGNFTDFDALTRLKAAARMDKTAAETMPVLRMLPEFSQVYCRKSSSGSCDREPSSTTMALEPLTEMTIGVVADGSATGGMLTLSWASTLTTPVFTL